MDYKEKIKGLPNSPGVYVMKDEKGSPLYVGKAGNLKRRVASYFRPGQRLPERIESLISKVNDITYIPTSTSAEALIYENSLIKELLPKYNVALKDSKSYPFLKLTMNEGYPRLFITRQRKNDGAVYFGPYTNVKLLREALGILKRIFPLRTCASMPKDVCLEYHIKQCLGPCAGKVDEAGYKDVVSELKLFLDGKRSELVKLLSGRMAQAALSENFEEAARIKNRIEALSAVRERTIDYSPAASLEELKNILGIAGHVERIEAFDVSNIMGHAAVGSMIYFYKARPRRSEYRRFKIKTVFKIDDYGMMRELINRRYKRLVDEKKELPDMILVDGGKGQLSAALGELKKLGIFNIPVIGIAKPARLQDNNVRSGGEFEHIYLKGKKEPILLPKTSKALHLLERIRDEAHRFAISYHKALLSKGIARSELDDIPGIGNKRKKALINHFGSIEKVRAASREELVKVRGMNEKSARNIIEYFKK